MRALTLIMCFMMFLAPHRGSAQTGEGTKSFSLKEAQDYAAQNNRTILNARLDLDAARQRIWENTASGLPQISASAGYTDNLQLMTTLIPAEFFGGDPGTFMPVQFGTQHNATASIIASQLLFSGPYIIGIQAASKYRDLTENTLLKTESDIREAVAKSYYSILLAEASRDAYAKNLESMKQRLEETGAMVETGFLEESDLDQIQIAVSNLENEYNASVHTADLSYRYLLYVMGYDTDAEISLSESLDDIITGLTGDLLRQEFVVENHIDYRILNTQEQLAYLQVKLNKSEYLPVLSVNLNHSQSAMRRSFNFLDFDRDWYPSTLLSFNLSVPVFSSGMRRARTGQSRIELEKTRNLKTDLVSGLELTVAQARIDFNTAYEKYLNEKDNVRLARKVFDNTSVKYRDGMVSSLEMSVASDQLTGVNTGYISAMVELLNARLKLDKALGNL